MNVYRGLVQRASIRSFVTIEDVSNVIPYLCVDVGCRISKQVLSVDGYTETLRWRDYKSTKCLPYQHGLDTKTPSWHTRNNCRGKY